MNTLNKFRKYGFIAILFGAVALNGCKDDDDETTPAPPAENEEEVTTDVKLIFTNTMNANDTVIARAQDPDGEGVMELQILDTIRLDTGKTYRLTYEIFNNLESPGEDIGAEIKEEDDEHQIFYGFTSGAFVSPLGDGNIDAAGGVVNYEDEDSDAQDNTGNPVGLITTWTTSSSTLNNGSFTTRLQHQPDGIKTATSTATDGDNDFALTFVLEIN